MSDLYSRRRTDERRIETPPFSRLFVVCSKQLTNSDLSEAFSDFGHIENVYIPLDRSTGISKGVAYIQYSKTSEAALAMQELDKKCIGHVGKPLKIFVASNKDDNQNTNDDKHNRLFVVCSKTSTEDELTDYFSTFGEVESVYLHRDRSTDKSKGFAYIQYKSFLGAAHAYEECDKKYKPIFATPRDNLKRNRATFESNINNVPTNSRNSFSDSFGSSNSFSNSSILLKENITSMLKPNSDGYTRVSVIHSPRLTQQHIEKLFNIIPGMEYCQYMFDKTIVTYENSAAAAHAVERLHNFEYPLGERLIVKPHINPLSKAADNLSNLVNNFKNAMSSENVMPDLVQLAEAIAQASSLIKVVTNDTSKSTINDNIQESCNVSLPCPKPLADPNHPIVKRCYIYCKPYPPPANVLTDVFSRFGDLIKVVIMPNKLFGFVSYASTVAADMAINTLNGAIVCGSTINVTEARERNKSDDDNDEQHKKIKTGE